MDKITQLQERVAEMAACMLDALTYVHEHAPAPDPPELTSTTSEARKAYFNEMVRSDNPDGICCSNAALVALFSS